MSWTCFVGRANWSRIVGRIASSGSMHARARGSPGKARLLLARLLLLRGPEPTLPARPGHRLRSSLHADPRQSRHGADLRTRVTVLIFGGAGFVGLNIAEALLAPDRAVMIFDLSAPPRAPLRTLQARFQGTWRGSSAT